MTKKPVAKASRNATKAAAPATRKAAPAAPVKKKVRPVQEAAPVKKAKPVAKPAGKVSAKPVAKTKPTAKVSKAAAVPEKGAFGHLPRASELGLEAIEAKYSRTMIVEEMAETADISLKQAKIALATFEDILKCHLCGGGSGLFILPGLFKAQVRIKPAVAGGKRAINPFTKEEYITKPKPAAKVLKLLPLKGLKDAVATR